MHAVKLSDSFCFFFNTEIKCLLIVTMIILSTNEIVSSVTVLGSNPPSTNGQLTACAGQKISLTCSHNHNIFIPGATVWRASLPVNCYIVIRHSSPYPRDCGPFNIREITRVTLPLPTHLDSTAVVTAHINMTGTNIECRGGDRFNNILVGNIALCVVGESIYIRV